MQAHHQTVFMIEQLQPSWLSGPWSRCLYILLTRVIIGAVFVGAMFLFAFGLVSHYGEVSGLTRDALDFLLSDGILILGLVFASADLRQAVRGLEGVEYAGKDTVFGKIKKILVRFLIMFIAAAVLTGVYEGFTGISRSLGPDDLDPTMMPSFMAAAYWAVRSSFRNIASDILPGEAVKWMFRHAFIGCGWGLLVAWLIYESVSHAGFLSQDAVLDQFYFFIYFGLIGAFFGGFQKVAFVSETQPNQGIVRSTYRAVVMAIVLATLTGGMTLLFQVMNESAQFTDMAGVDLGSVLLSSGTIGLSFGVLAALRYGIMDSIQHYVLRLLLAMRRQVPFDIARFLDFAARDLEFMQKVGGGYIFMHRNLLEYFASLPEQAKPDSSTGQVAAAGEAP